METVITVSIIVLNIFSLLMLYKMLIGMDLKNKIITAVVLIISALIISNIVYGIASGQMAIEAARTLKPYMLFTLFPINSMIMASPIAIQINKAESQEIKKEELFRKIAILLLIDIIIIIVECNYLKSTISRIPMPLNNI